jgi:hypothetical protein
MAESTVVAVPRDGTISITNGDATTYTVSYENGDMSMNLDKAERIVIYDRATIVGLRAGNDPVPSISFSSPMQPRTLFWILYTKQEIPVGQLPPVEQVLNNFFVL